MPRLGIIFFSYVIFSAAALAQTPVFSAPTSLPVQQAPLAITTADFNADGKLDIAIANSYTETISIFLGSGTGTFTAAPGITLPTGCEAAFLANGNFAGTGRPDLLAICPLGAFVVVPNNGHGGFSAPIPEPLPAAAWVGNLLFGYIHPAIGDFNGDGKLDIVIPTVDLNATDERNVGAWYVLLGKGDGTFLTPTTIPFSGLLPVSLAAGDYNGDGKLDLVTLSYDGAGFPNLQFATGNGDGTFNAPLVYNLLSDVGSILIPADVNGDGKLDVVMAGSALYTGLTKLGTDQGDSAVTVYLGDGKGHLGIRPYTVTEPNYMSGAALAPILGTGKLDLIEGTIQADFTHGGPVKGSIQIRPGNGDGTFGSPILLNTPITTIPTDLTVVDINGDGKLDILASSLPSTGLSISANLDSDFASLLRSVLVQLPNGNVTILLNQTPSAPTFTTTNAATFAAGPLAKASIVTAFGTALAAAAVNNTSLNVPTTLGGVTINVKDSTGANLPAPLFFVSPGQINYEIPDNAATGLATITINSGTATFTAQQQIVAVSPGIFANSGLAAALSVRTVNGVQQSTLTAPNGALAPIDVSDGQTFLILFGTGIRNHANPVTATINGTQIPTAYAGATGTYVGEDQINIQLPATLKGAGTVGVTLQVDGQTTNSVQIRIQ